MSNAFDHLHIKRHTAGSSNELSFDVLDAARDGYAPKKKRFGRRGGPQVLRPVRQEPLEPRVIESPITPVAEPVQQPEETLPASPKTVTTRPSYHRAMGKSALSSHDEVTSRKRQRRTRTIVISAAVSLVAIAMMVGAAYAGYQHYEKMQLFQDKFDSLVGLFVEADEVLPLTDAFMADPFGASAEERGQMQQSAALASLSLQQLTDERALVLAYTVDEQDEQALEQVEKASADRQAMMAAALRAAEVVGESDVQSSEVNTVWHKVIGTDEKARSATAAANVANTDEAIADAREQTIAAQDELKQILKEMKALGKERPDLDLSNHVAYLQKRIESLDHAVATGDALLKGDRTLAAQENAAYNEADKEAAKLGSLLPLSAEHTVKEAFEEEVISCKADYDAARNKAIQSDALIRLYMRG